MKFLPFLFSALLLFSSCREFGKRIKGNGNVTSQERALSGFTAIDVSSSIDVYVRQDSSAAKIRVETDDNIQQYITTTEGGGVLYIDIKKNYNPKPTKGIKVYVSGPEFRKFVASGDCDIVSENQLSSQGSVDIHLSGACDANLQLKAPRIIAGLTGAGTLTLKGQTRDLEMKGTGSSTLHCFDMLSENATVHITGAGDAEVSASVKLDVHVTGSGSVKYRGSPAVSQQISGAGNIRKVD
jgi:hypothetical protein